MQEEKYLTICNVIHEMDLPNTEVGDLVDTSDDDHVDANKKTAGADEISDSEVQDTVGAKEVLSSKSVTEGVIPAGYIRNEIRRHFKYGLK